MSEKSFVVSLHERLFLHSYLFHVGGQSSHEERVVQGTREGGTLRPAASGLQGKKVRISGGGSETLTKGTPPG